MKNLKNRTLYPHAYQRIGWVLLAFAIICVAGIYWFTPKLNGSDAHDITKILDPYTKCFPGIILGLLMLGFSKEKVEDEHILKLRLESVRWAMVVNYSVLFYCFFFVSGSTLQWMIMLNLLTPLIFFVVHFKWKIWKLNRESNQMEELA